MEKSREYQDAYIDGVADFTQYLIKFGYNPVILATFSDGLILDKGYGREFIGLAGTVSHGHPRD